MEITLITSVKGDEVHGTDNDKKTGCGINLLKPENVTRYRRSGVMNDLKEITCERCKTILAKKIIKADKKEMTRLIKEEKARAKKGIEDESIVPLGNTVAKITRSPEEIRAEEERKLAEKKAAEKAEAEKREAERKAAEERAAAEKKAAEEEAARVAAPKTIPGTGIAFDSDLAAFAINVPKEEESTPVNNVQDDFLAQFAIQKPEEDAEEEKAEASPVQDDFLAQFAIPAPVQEETPAPAETVSAPEPVADEMGDVFAAADEALANDYVPVQSSEYYPQAAEEAPVETVEEKSDDDIMKMFSIGGDASTGMEVLSGTEPVETSIYDNDDAVIDVNEHEIAADDTDYSKEAPAETANVQSVEETSEWDYVANQLFGFEGVEMPELNAEEAITETVPEPVAEEPVIEDIAVPESVAEEPAIEDIAVPEPVAEEPVIEDIAVPEPVAEEPVIEDIAVPEPVAEEPVIEDIAVPEPVAEEPVIEEIAAPEPVAEETSSIGDVEVNKYRYSTPVFADEKVEEKPVVPEQPQMTAPVQPMPAPVQPQMTAPVQPAPTPVQPQMTAPVQPMPAPVQPQMTAPVQPVALEQPSVITVPQFAGYDMNGQPIYNYVQMQMTGYDMNGQPIFAPLQQMNTPVQPAAPVQPMVAPVQQSAPVQQPAPVQPHPQMTAPVQPVVAPVQQNTPYRTPTANISKIATNPHSKPIPKSFVNALANSREQGKKNLIETQGKNQMPVLDSIEDVLTQMGDEATIKNRNQTQNVPVFDEYKAPVRSASAAPKAPKAAEPERMLTKAELKAKKKQDKIDAKFKKDLAKRGF